MEQPATSNAITGAEQSGNIAKQRFAGIVEILEAYRGNLGGLTNEW